MPCIGSRSVLAQRVRHTSEVPAAGLSQSRRETATASQDRDDLIDQRQTARAYTAITLGSGPASGGREPGEDAGGGQRSKWHLFGHRSASPQAAAPPGQAANGHPPDVPASDDPAAASADTD